MDDSSSLETLLGEDPKGKHSTSIHKHYLDKDVYTATIERLEMILDEFDKYYISFSGGKDSSVLLHMLIEIAEKKGKLPVSSLFIDLEAQYKATIKHVEEMMINNPKVKPYWICLPFNLRNAVSVYQSQWTCWNPEEKEKWVREMPTYDCVISDTEYFPFYRFGMEFEEFVIDFAEWLSGGEKTACIVAIRSDESLNRFRTIKNMKKERYKNYGYSTRISETVYNFYPIYDWKTEDIWTAVGRFGYKYNKIYDFMYMQGKSIHECRICQPYGDDQRKGLDLFRMCEPETWGRVVNRVSGANFGNIYCNSFLLGNRKIIKPEGHTWKSYVEFLLDTLPRHEAEWYNRKFKVFFDWWAEHGYPIEKVPDEADPKLESQRKVPSWRRIAKCILKNDKLCKSLSFKATKNQYTKYMQLQEEYGEKDE
ncbi:MAG: phosphoadenosine phosphosulfate reductase [Candidatus Hodarchaeales archaeon]